MPSWAVISQGPGLDCWFYGRSLSFYAGHGGALTATEPSARRPPVSFFATEQIEFGALESFTMDVEKRDASELSNHESSVA